MRKLTSETLDEYVASFKAKSTRQKMRDALTPFLFWRDHQGLSDTPITAQEIERFILANPRNWNNQTRDRYVGYIYKYADLSQPKKLKLKGETEAVKEQGLFEETTQTETYDADHETAVSVSTQPEACQSKDSEETACQEDQYNDMAAALQNEGRVIEPVKRGRSKGVKRVQCSTYLDQETYEGMKDLALYEHLTIGEMLSKLADNFVKRNEDQVKAMQNTLKCSLNY